MYYVDAGTTPVATVNIPKHRKRLLFNTVQVPLTLLVGTPHLILKFLTDYININWITFSREACTFNLFFLFWILVRVVPTPSPLQCLVVPAGSIIAFFLRESPQSSCWYYSCLVLVLVE